MSAQSLPPVRERQERRVSLSGNPEEPGPEVRVAAGITTYVRFDAPLDKAAVEVEGHPVRFKSVELGETLVALEPSVDLGAEERLVVRVHFRDGASPTRATLSLVTRPGVVDKEVEVVRRPRTLEALEAALAETRAQLAALQSGCRASGPTGLVFSGQLDVDGVRVRRFESASVPAQSGLEYVRGEAYRAKRWSLAVVRVRNLPGQPPWVPGSASLSRDGGASARALSLAMDREQLAAGEEGLIVVETKAPLGKAEDGLRLELLDKTGSRRFSILNVNL